MDKETAEKTKQFINLKWLTPKMCPICGNPNLGLIEEIVEIRPFNGGNIVVGGELFPYNVIVCSNCGYTIFFNAIKTGAVKSPLEEKK